MTARMAVAHGYLVLEGALSMAQLLGSLALYVCLESATAAASLLKVPTRWQIQVRQRLWRPLARRLGFARGADLMWWASYFSRMSSANTKPAPLPPHILDALTDPKGCRMMDEAQCLDWALIKLAEPQAHPCWCWRATAVVLMNAVGAAPPQECYSQASLLGRFDSQPLPPSFFQAYGRLSFLDRLHLPWPAAYRWLLEWLSYGGVSMQVLCQLMGCYEGVAVDLKAATMDGEAAFMADVSHSLGSVGTACEQRLVVCFSREAMDMIGVGHFAPIVGLSAAGDHVLVLDSNSWRYPRLQWMSASRLWAACCTATGYGQPRGYFIVNRARSGQR